jgi:hypothetical protein
MFLHFWSTEHLYEFEYFMLSAAARSRESDELDRVPYPAKLGESPTRSLSGEKGLAGIFRIFLDMGPDIAKDFAT